MSSIAVRIFNTLCGHWRITKSQNNHVLMEGEGIFTPVEEGFSLHEKGFWTRDTNGFYTKGQEYFQETFYTLENDSIVLHRPHPLFVLTESPSFVRDETNPSFEGNLPLWQRFLCPVDDLYTSTTVRSTYHLSRSTKKL